MPTESAPTTSSIHIKSNNTPHVYFETEEGSPIHRAVSWVDRNRFWLIGLTIVLYILGFQPHWRPGPDSAQQLIYARSIASGEPHRFAEQVTDPLNPGIAYIAASIEKLIGPDSIITGTLTINLLLSFATLLIAYRFFRLLTNRGSAVLLLIMLACCETFYHYSFEILSETGFSLGFIICLYAWEKQHQKQSNLKLNLLLITLGITIMALFRSVAIVMIAAMSLALLYELFRQKRYKLIASFAIGIPLTLLIARLALHSSAAFTLQPDERIMFNRLTNHLGQTLTTATQTNIPKLFNEVTPEAIFALDFGPIASIPISILLLFYCFSLFRVRPLWGFTFLLFITQWILYIVADRYFMPLMPLIVIAWWLPVIWVEKHCGYRLSKVTVIAATLAFIIPNLARDTAFIIDQHQSDFPTQYKRGKYIPVYQTAEWLKQNTTKDSTFTAINYLYEIDYLSQRAGQRNLLPEKTPQYFIGPIPDSYKQAAKQHNIRIGEILFQPVENSESFTIRRLYPQPQQNKDHINTHRDTTVPQTPSAIE